MIRPQSFCGRKSSDEESLLLDYYTDSLSLSDTSVELSENEYCPFETEPASEDSEFESSDNENKSAVDSDEDDGGIPLINALPVCNWTDVSGTTLRYFSFPGKPAINFTGEPTPIGCYKAIVDQEVVDLIVTETNRFSDQKLGRHKWKATTVDEIMKFLGLVCYMGLVKYPKISDYWSKKKI